MKIVHYSKCTREKDKHPGGVEKFSWYLQKAIGCELVTPKDKPNLADPNTLYIVDAHWGLKIDPKCKVICMMHGCAGERDFNKEIGIQQKKMMQRKNTYFVANSIETFTLCKKYYGRECDEIIHLAVDEDKYYDPIEKFGFTPKTVLTTTAKKGNKGYHILGKLNDYLKKDEIKIHDMNCKLDEEYFEFRDADMFILLSKHEGFAYSILEAMSANLPVLASPHGIGFDMKDLGVIDIIEESNMWNIPIIAEKIKEILSRDEPVNTRQYVKDNYSLESFNTKWKNLIDRMS